VKSPHPKRFVLVLATAAGISLAAASAAMAAPVPLPDAQAVGGITLCNQQGAQVTSGSLDAKPFIWRAVGSTGAPAGYRKGGTATLYAFQPRQGVDPSDWSGEQLTASSRYTQPAHPTAASTYADESLRTYLGDYPAMWHGYVQLRLFLGAPGEGPLTYTYDAADLQVTGGTWRLLNSGPADCTTSGRSVSVESLTLSHQQLAHAKRTALKLASDTNGQPATTAGAQQSTATAASSQASGTAALSADSGAGTSHSGRNAAVVAALAVMVAVGAALALRRRS
jgi:hypothetical protein